MSDVQSFVDDDILVGDAKTVFAYGIQKNGLIDQIEAVKGPFLKVRRDLADVVLFMGFDVQHDLDHVFIVDLFSEGILKRGTDVFLKKQMLVKSEYDLFTGLVAVHDPIITRIKECIIVYVDELNFFERLKGHFSTITRHKLTVQHLCFRCGLYKQGLLHDLSKYSWTEFSSGVKYYQGYRSPIDKEKELTGMSQGWLHHKGRNKHHWDYWVDREYRGSEIVALPMPFNYVLESVCDKIAASKIYAKEKYNDAYAYEFFMKGNDRKAMNPKTVHEIETLLGYLKDNGEEKALRYYRELYHKWKKDKTFTV